MSYLEWVRIYVRRARWNQPSRLLFGGGNRLLRHGGLLETVRPAEFLAEAFDPTGSIDEFLLASEEGMAGRADIDGNFGDRAARGEGVAAGTVNGAGLITGVDFCFHGKLLSILGRAWRHNAVTSAVDISYTKNRGNGFDPRPGPRCDERGKFSRKYGLWQGLSLIGLSICADKTDGD